MISLCGCVVIVSSSSKVGLISSGVGLPVLPDGFLTTEGLRITCVIFNLSVLQSCGQMTFSCNLSKGVERGKIRS